MPLHWDGQGLGAEARASEVRPGERTGVGCVETAWGGKGVVHHNPGNTGRSLGPPKRQGTIVGEGVWKEGRDYHRSFSLHSSSQVAGHCLHELQGRVWAATTISDSRGGCRPLPLLRVPQKGANCHPHLPGSVCGLRTCTHPIKGITASTHWGKRWQAFKPETAFTPNKYYTHTSYTGPLPHINSLQDYSR